MPSEYQQAQVPSEAIYQDGTVDHFDPKNSLIPHEYTKHLTPGYQLCPSMIDELSLDCKYGRYPQRLAHNVILASDEDRVLEDVVEYLFETRKIISEQNQTIWSTIGWATDTTGQHVDAHKLDEMALNGEYGSGYQDLANKTFVVSDKEQVSEKIVEYFRATREIVLEQNHWLWLEHREFIEKGGRDVTRRKVDICDHSRADFADCSPQPTKTLLLSNVPKSHDIDGLAILFGRVKGFRKPKTFLAQTVTAVVEYEDEATAAAAGEKVNGVQLGDKKYLLAVAYQGN